MAGSCLIEHQVDCPELLRCECWIQSLVHSGLVEEVGEGLVPPVRPVEFNLVLVWGALDSEKVSGGEPGVRGRSYPVEQGQILGLVRRRVRDISRRKWCALRIHVSRLDCLLSETHPLDAQSDAEWCPKRLQQLSDRALERTPERVGDGPCGVE